MSITGKDIAAAIEAKAPAGLALEWDNTGWQVGDPQKKVKRVLIALDATQTVLAEAKKIKADLIVTHHPLLFEPTKRLLASTDHAGLIYALARAGIGLFSAHTNLDAAAGGINDMLLSKLGAASTGQVLEPAQRDVSYKLTVFVPHEDFAAVSRALSEAGAGVIGNYAGCAFRTKGTGTFVPGTGANPTIGKRFRPEEVSEYRLETIVSSDRLYPAIDAMRKAHSYEEPAFDIYRLEPAPAGEGFGRVGEWRPAITQAAFFSCAAKTLKIPVLRCAGKAKGKISRIAVCGGSGATLWRKAHALGCQALLTGDVKYHDALDAQQAGFLLVDAGHFATERIAINILHTWLKAAFGNLDIAKFKKNADPFRMVNA